MAARVGLRHFAGELRTSRSNVASGLPTLSLETFFVRTWNDRVASEQPSCEKCLKWRVSRSLLTSGDMQLAVRQYESASCGTFGLPPVSRVAECSVRRYFLGPGNLAGAEQFSSLRAEGTGASASESSRQETVPDGEDNSSAHVAQDIQSHDSVQEFIPEGQDIPSTPLVQAIQSREKEYTEELAKAAEPRVADEYSSSDNESPNEGATTRPMVDTDREIQPNRVYFGGLPFSLKGDALKNGIHELCSKYGEVLNITLAQFQHQSQKSIKAGKHRGFAFVTMETPEQAQDVIKNLNCTMAFGRTILVSHGLKLLEPPQDKPKIKEAQLPRRKVFVGNLDEGTTSMTLIKRFEEYGKIESCKLIGEIHSNKSRGFAFITFTEEAQAMKAILDLDGAILDGSVIKVNLAKYPQTY